MAGQSVKRFQAEHVIPSLHEREESAGFYKNLEAQPDPGLATRFSFACCRE
jgi:hypothetical protein